MRQGRLFAFVLFVGLYSYSAVWTAAAETRITRDVPYKTEGTDYEKSQCRVDIYAPEDGKDLPVLVWFHGGGLTSGDKAGGTEQVFGKLLASEGFVMLSVNYRHNPLVRFPAYIEDAAAAVAWVARNVKDYGGDPTAIFVSGHSAGGYLTAMLASDPQYLAAEACTPDTVCGYLPVSGQLDSHTTVRAEQSIFITETLVDRTAPLFFVSKDLRPVLVIIGGREDEHRMAMNLRYYEELKAAGHPTVEYLRVADRNHGTIVGNLADPDDVVTSAMIRFMRRHAPKKLIPAAHRLGETP